MERKSNSLVDLIFKIAYPKSTLNNTKETLKNSLKRYEKQTEEKNINDLKELYQLKFATEGEDYNPLIEESFNEFKKIISNNKIKNSQKIKSSIKIIKEIVSLIY